MSSLLVAVGQNPLQQLCRRYDLLAHDCMGLRESKTVGEMVVVMFNCKSKNCKSQDVDSGVGCRITPDHRVPSLKRQGSGEH